MIINLNKCIPNSENSRPYYDLSVYEEWLDFHRPNKDRVEYARRWSRIHYKNLQYLYFLAKLNPKPYMAGVEDYGDYVVRVLPYVLYHYEEQRLIKMEINDLTQPKPYRW